MEMQIENNNVYGRKIVSEGNSKSNKITDWILVPRSK